MSLIPRPEPTGTDDAVEPSRLLRLPFITDEIAILVDRYAVSRELETGLADIGRSL
jgi:hypothetical protein